MAIHKTALFVWLLMALATTIAAVAVIMLPPIEASARPKDGQGEDGTGGST